MKACKIESKHVLTIIQVDDNTTDQAERSSLCIRLQMLMIAVNKSFYVVRLVQLLYSKNSV